VFIDNEITNKMLEFLENEHFRYVGRVGETAHVDEVDLSSGWSLESSIPDSPLVSQMLSDFRTFLETCTGLELSRTGADRKITFALEEVGTQHISKDESFTITVSEELVNVVAKSERGLLQASHYLERQMSLRGGPYLKKGVIEKSPNFSPRISNTVFCIADGSIDNPNMLTDRYLSLMSHFGINGVHVYIPLWDYCNNSILPELNDALWQDHALKLRDLCLRTAKYGIDIYPVVFNQFFLEDAEVFKAHPDVRGARLNYPTPDDRYCLCSSSEKTQACYNETFTNLFKAVPELGGAILIIGGEGFIHCFTRPKPPLAGGTSCPHCAGHNPSKDVAKLVNSIAGAVHSVSKDAKFFVWPYSAFTWSGKDFAQTEFIRNLHKDVLMLSNFATPHTVKLMGAETVISDYNIVNIGPSEQFAEQSRELAARDMLHYAKIESTTEPGWFFLPYLPVHYRWIERINSMKKYNVPGYVSKWRFYGFTGSMPEEILCQMNWNDDIDPDALLLNIAKRDFGDVSDRILEGWKILSDTWPKIPSGFMIWGEREFYMKGPVYLGPAHPLILDVQKRYDLGHNFFTLRGDAGEFLSDEERDELEKNAPPRYSSDLLYTYPFGANVIKAEFESSVKAWSDGVALIEGALGDKPNKRAQMEMDICRIIGIHLHTAWNVTRFYIERDALFSNAGNSDELEARINRLVEIIDDEIDNARNALPIIERDFRIGYGHSYGQVYDAEMLREKIQQCEWVRDIELPAFKTGVLFHVYGEYR